MAGDVEELPDPLVDPENHALMETLFSVVMGTADAARDGALCKLRRDHRRGAATEGMTKDETKAFLDRWARVVIERERNEAPKLQ